MNAKKNLCAMIPADLHAKVIAEKEQLALSTLGEYVELVLKEHFEGGKTIMAATKTLAFQISEELDQRLKELGYPQVFMGTVEAEPSLDTLLEKIQTLHVKRVILAPFMVVAGDHAINDMSGDEEDSWKSTFEKAGYEVECILKGLGEYPAVRQIYVKHALEV